MTFCFICNQRFLVTSDLINCENCNNCSHLNCLTSCLSITWSRNLCLLAFLPYFKSELTNQTDTRDPLVQLLPTPPPSYDAPNLVFHPFDSNELDGNPILGVDGIYPDFNIHKKLPQYTSHYIEPNQLRTFLNNLNYHRPFGVAHINCRSIINELPDI